MSDENSNPQAKPELYIALPKEHMVAIMTYLIKQEYAEVEHLVVPIRFMSITQEVMLVPKNVEQQEKK